MTAVVVAYTVECGKNPKTEMLIFPFSKYLYELYTNDIACKLFIGCQIPFPKDYFHIY